MYILSQALFSGMGSLDLAKSLTLFFTSSHFSNSYCGRKPECDVLALVVLWCDNAHHSLLWQSSLPDLQAISTSIGHSESGLQINRHATGESFTLAEMPLDFSARRLL